jgi:protein kinase C substrate 80K-H
MNLILILIALVNADLISINSTHFTCDKNRTLHINNINDNYCDCDDGSDENKTNACPNGIFYCENKLYLSKTISTSKVSIFKLS